MTTFETRIAAGADDGRWYPTFSNNATSVAAGNISLSVYKSFLRFVSIPIVQGATITAAYIALTVAVQTTTDTCVLTIAGEKAVNPAAVTSQADGDARVLTTETVAWTGATNLPDPFGPALAVINTPDLTAVVQEIVDQGSWASGNAMQFFIMDNGSPENRYIQPYALESVTTDTEALLHIEYLGGSGAANFALLGVG